MSMTPTPHLIPSIQGILVFQVVKLDRDLSCALYVCHLSGPSACDFLKLENLQRLSAPCAPDHGLLWETATFWGLSATGTQGDTKKEQIRVLPASRDLSGGTGYTSRQWDRLERGALGICANSAIAFA